MGTSKENYYDPKKEDPEGYAKLVKHVANGGSAWHDPLVNEANKTKKATENTPKQDIIKCDYKDPKGNCAGCRERMTWDKLKAMIPKYKAKPDYDQLRGNDGIRIKRGYGYSYRLQKIKKTITKQRNNIIERNVKSYGNGYPTSDCYDKDVEITKLYGRDTASRLRSENPDKAQKGVGSSNQDSNPKAQVDHIVGKAQGGCNCYANAQVVSQGYNLRKSCMDNCNGPKAKKYKDLLKKGKL